jgi:hypothetical protein
MERKLMLYQNVYGFTAARQNLVLEQQVIDRLTTLWASE